MKEYLIGKKEATQRIKSIFLIDVSHNINSIEIYK